MKFGGFCLVFCFVLLFHKTEGANSLVRHEEQALKVHV